MGVKETSLDAKEVIILALLKLNYGSEIKGRRRLHQLLFLAQNDGFEGDPVDSPIADYFDFKKSDYGPKSDMIDKSLDLLIAEEFIGAKSQENRDKPTQFHITESGSRAVDRHREDIRRDDIRTLKIVKRLYNEIPQIELFDRFRAQYPDYVTNVRL